MAEDTCTAVVYPLFPGKHEAPSTCGAPLTTYGAFPGYVRCTRGHLNPAPALQAV